ncbi:MAG: hypothetical protein N3A38_13940 [Planctomycetota bacterium]|nr:hypothetical protein [Planctomycetota bacterium]
MVRPVAGRVVLYSSIWSAALGAAGMAATPDAGSCDRAGEARAAPDASGGSGQAAVLPFRQLDRRGKDGGPGRDGGPDRGSPPGKPPADGKGDPGRRHDIAIRIASEGMRPDTLKSSDGTRQAAAPGAPAYQIPPIEPLEMSARRCVIPSAADFFLPGDPRGPPLRS